MADSQVKLSERLLSPDTYKKYAGYLIITFMIFLVVFGGVSLYRYFFPKKPTNNVTVQSGGTATFVQTSDRKRFIIPFVEVYGGMNVDDKSNGRTEFGGRLGLRFEW